MIKFEVTLANNAFFESKLTLAMLKVIFPETIINITI
jgi:hypothetical protein